MNSQTQFGAPAAHSLRCIAFVLSMLLVLLTGATARATTPWEQPAAQLAEQIAAILGPGQAQLVIGNRSTIATADVSAIRRLLEQDLHTHSIEISVTESANQIRVTLSENIRERLWVAEVAEGNQRQVTMVRVDRETVSAATVAAGLVLRKERIWSSLEGSSPTIRQTDEPVLAALETRAGLVVLKQDEIVLLAHADSGWQEQKRFPLQRQHGSPRDPRGLLAPIADGSGFTAYTAGMQCSGNNAMPIDNSGRYGEWTVHCHESDDPWPVVSRTSTTDNSETGSTEVKAFYNAARNYFTGVTTPNQGAELVPFYSVAVIPRPASNRPALLLSGIDGKVQVAEGSSLKPVSGARDWGSDIATLHSGCGAGAQMIASSSGEAMNDSLRAYDISAQEAVAVSTPLEMGGAVMSLWTAPDGTSTWTVVRKSNNEYEVDRVTALCP
jgi:hypothetical protein